MFKLERVEISGFKSFYEKVDLAFPGDVTAVVGPNGCGKSNICDAVAWALGEQSAKILRGERMDDVIFNGSAKRRPLGMAEVILTLSPRSAGAREASSDSAGGNGNGNGAGFPATTSDSETLRIGRRVYREGEGEYFLNDKQVRLKDIQDRLLGTGLGVRAYSVIEQGRIDQVLSTKPQDRRRLIEEAAGITKYKLKKRLAETKLEETRGNLLRLSDILAEIERNVASLKRQASRAARYKEHSETLRRLRRTLLRARHDALVAVVSAAEAALHDRRDREAAAAAELARAEAALAASRLDAAEASNERDRLRALVSSLEAAIQRDDALLESNRRASADLAERRLNLEREGRDSSAERQRSARELAETDERLARAVAEARARSLAREEADRKASEAGAALARLEREVEAARAESIAAAAERVAAANARHETEIATSRLAASIAAAEDERARVLAELSLREAETAGAEEERRRLADDARRAAAEVESWETEIGRLSREILEAEAAREAARESAGEAQHRLTALAEILRAREETTDSLRQTLARAGIASSGRLSQRIRPVPGWEAAIDLVLGEDSSALLSVADPIRAVELARELPGATFVRGDWPAGAALGSPSRRGSDWEAALQNYRELSAAERAALPLVRFVATLEEALALSRDEPGLAFVTPRRELVRGSLVRSSNRSSEASGVFALRREIEDLERRVADQNSGVAALERSLEDLRRERAEREAEMPVRREREREAAAALSAHEARLEERRSERRRTELEFHTLESEIESRRAEAREAELDQHELEARERAAAERDASWRERVEALNALVPEARACAGSASEELSHRRTEAELAAERRRSLEAAREKLAESGAALARRIQDASEEGRRIATRNDELAREETEARGRRSGALAEREEQSARLQVAAAAADETAARAAGAEETARAARAALDLSREARFESEMADTRARADLEHLAAQALSEFGTPAPELEPPADFSAEALAALEKEAADLAGVIERLGPVNVLAYEEHKQESERLQFLTAQRDDLVESIAELQESIRKINATSSDRFRHAFDAINENFKTMFSRLFQGGAAQMRLLDENDVLESGVEIVAQPPGKRNQSILLLSGGEKALTAIALLMAIFRYKPSPFCILDEVDAPLDEANIDRFTRLLREMTEDTQFIAITHNKRTMETADVMYGVTMEEPGCSKIVSVKFD